jgi:crotonobetainyl-CoA:carnitine CoA-transferase CaiB-like acyl-CoA transferase
MQPLAGIHVVDFSTLLPGPLASLFLAEAGAEVVKIERADIGDEMRTYEPRLGVDSANFVLLNRGKGSVAIDLKAPDAVVRLTPLLKRADVLIEQFRPGVMERLGLGYDAVRAINDQIIYCSITGFGQRGPRQGVAGHDLNYLSLTGLLSFVADKDGTPSLPPALIADIAAGGYPAVINILLALMQRRSTGQGSHLDISMTDNLFVLAYWGLANGFAAGRWPRPGAELVTGGSPRYHVYRTADGGHLSAAPIEQRFWDVFCRLIGLDERFHDDSRDPAKVIEAVAACIIAQPTDHWRRVFAEADACCAVVASLAEAVEDPHFRAHNLFGRQTGTGSMRIPALPLPLAEAFRDPALTKLSPALGADNHLVATQA